MGCTSSTPSAVPAPPTEPTADPAAAAPVSHESATNMLCKAGIRILVVGPPSSGKTALCRRFLHKTFEEEPEAEGPGFCSGTRQIGINKQPLDITLIDCDDIAGRPDSFNEVDAVIYVVSAEADEPFTGVYRYLDAFYNSSNASTALLGAPEGFSLPCSPTVSEETPRLVTPSVSVGRPSSASFSKDWMSASGGSSRPSLQLVTSKPALRDEAAVTFNRAPMSVFVSKADAVDSSAGRRLMRLRAMAQNWAAANRCKVTFVSSKTGAGINTGVDKLIKQVWHRKHAELQRPPAAL